ncbi:MAG: hypothetical protein SGILL_004845 [Bacillariaceae sp.]
MSNPVEASQQLANDDDDERIQVLVQQGYTPSMARNVVAARSQENMPLTIWIVDNSSSMNIKDGRRMLPTARLDDVKVMACTRWEELKETVLYHAQLAALLEAPTKFVLLNPVNATSHNATSFQKSCPQEMSIAERGREWIDDDTEDFMENFANIQPSGATPLTSHLQRIFDSLHHHMESKIVLVLATDGKPTDSFGYSSPTVDREFEAALRKVQSKAWVVIRLCTDDEHVLNYYQKLDDQEEFDLEVLDDYLDEAKEVYSYNAWLTYSLSLHRCREMGMSCHATFRFLDWLDERQLSREETLHALSTLGVVPEDDPTSMSRSMESLMHNDGDWATLCGFIDEEQRRLGKLKVDTAKVYSPWNPIRKRTTPLIDIRQLRRQGSKKSLVMTGLVSMAFAVAMAILVQLILSMELW